MFLVVNDRYCAEMMLSFMPKMEIIIEQNIVLNEMLNTAIKNRALYCLIAMLSL
jgi:hypothetical protein